MKTNIKTKSGLPKLAVISRSPCVFNVLVVTLMAIATFAHAGVNLEATPPPGYSQPLTVYQRDGRVFAAWAVGNRGNVNAAPFEVGFYVNGQRVLVARFSSGLPVRTRGHGEAPLTLPPGTSTVELRANDSRRVTEDTYADNNFSVRVQVNNSGGGGGGNPPVALTRAQAGYKFPSTLNNSSGSRITSLATDFFSVQWVAPANFTNWLVSGNTVPYSSGIRYFGLPYSQTNPQMDVTGFLGHLPSVRGTLTSTTGVGTDCSGFASIVLELPSRHTTWSFDQPSSHFWTVVPPGALVRNASRIQPGDVISSSSWGHCVVVLSAPVNGRVSVLESTVDQGTNVNGSAQRNAVVRNTRSLSDLDRQNCRVIRRNNLN